MASRRVKTRQASHGSRPERGKTSAARKRTPIVLAAIVILAGCLAYANSFNGPFVGDDVDAIVNNPNIRSLSPITRALTAPKDTTVAGRPAVSLSFAINYALASASDRLNSWGYHAFNLGVHLCAGILLFGVVGSTLRTSPLRTLFGDISTVLAFATAILWVLHPLQTQSVTYVVQRAESLMGLCYLLTLYCAIRATEPGARAHRWIAAAVGSCALGMGSKEVMVSAPLIVGLWIWLFRRDQRLPQRQVAVLLVGLTSTWILLGLLLLSDPRGESVGFGLGGWTWWSYLRTQAGVIVHYIRLALFPYPLVFQYAWPAARSWAEVAPQIVLLALFIALTVAALARRHPAGFLGAWFFLILAPSSSVVPIATEVAAEHRMYLPLAALIAAIVVCAHVAAMRFNPRLARPVLLVAVALTSVALGTATYARNLTYRSLEALMRDTVEKRPGNLNARVVLGGHLVSLERYADAEEQLRVAVSHDERTVADAQLIAVGHMYLGSALSAQNKTAEGILHLENALALSPSLDEAHAFLGEAYASEGRLPEAAASFERSIEKMADVPPLLERAASVFDRLAAERARSGRREDAIAAARRAVDLARRAGNTTAASEFERRLAFYVSAGSYRPR